MRQSPAQRASRLAIGLAVFCAGAGVGFAQEPGKGVFVDGVFVESYVYAADFMSPEALKNLIDARSGRVVIVDTAAPAIWEEEHIPGAVNVPWVRTLVPPVDLPRDKTLVLYCACKDHEDSLDMAEKLSHIGYTDVKILEGGWFKWVELGYDVAGRKPAVTAARGDGGVSSGLKVGAPTQSIPVLDVTGEYKGEPICYVCEFQDAPNVLAFFRETGEETARLLVRLNDLYRQHKARGFKAVAMIVAGEDAKPWLENLSRSARLEIPLTVFRRGPRDVATRLYELNPDAENTFLVTVNRTVAANVSRIRAAQFDRVASAAADVLAREKQ